MPVPCLPNKHSNELVLTPDYRVYTYIWANLKTNTKTSYSTLDYLYCWCH